MDRISVAMDATPLLGPRTGIGVAVAGMVRELGARSEVALTGYGFTLRGAHRLPGALPPGVRSVARPTPAALLLRVWARADFPSGDWWTGSADVVHGTNFVVPPTRRARRVVSVWDLTAVRYPEMCSPTSRRYPAVVGRAVAAGAWVHTGAQFVADEIVEHFGIEPARVRVIPPGLDLPARLKEPAGTQPSPRSGTQPYLLGLGTAEPRKDFPGLVRAFDLVAAEQPELELRLAGPPGWGEAELNRAIAASPHRARIRRMGWVEDLDGLIAGAEVFVFPSVYEGFGFPPLEAMGRGVPVVATSAGAVPEVVGDAAVLVPPGDTEALAGAITCVLQDRTRREQLVEAGRRQVARFSWARCGDQLVRLYRDLAGR